MRRILTYWMLAMILTSTARPQTGPMVPVQRFALHGVQQVDQEEVRRWFGLVKGQPFNPADLIHRGEALLREYARRGFFFARIDSILYKPTADSSGIGVDLYLNEGIPLRLGDMKVSGVDSARLQQLKNRFSVRRGQPLDGAKIEGDIDDVVSQIEKDGYPFGRVDLQDVRLDTLNEKVEGLTLDWKIVRGPRLVLREIVVQGNKITRPGVIIRETRIKPGDPFVPEKVARIRSRLMRTNYFSRVEEPEIFLSSGQEGGLLLQVEEGNSSRFDGVVGYVPSDATGSGYFNGLIDISLGNILGTGRILQAHWQKRDRKTQDIKLAYREPWVAGLPLHAGFAFSQLIQDTTYVQRDWSIDLNLPLYENLALTAALSHSQVAPDSIGSYVYGWLQSTTLSAALGLEYDSRDDRLNPQSGLYYQTTYQGGSKKNTGPAELIEGRVRSFSNNRTTLDFEFYTRLFKRQIVAVAVHGRQIKSSEPLIPLPDQFRLGGSKSLRGYREDQFRGSEVAWTNLEYRYWMGRRSRAFLFTDYGYYGAKEETGRRQAFKLGYGFGFRLQTGLGIMGIDYGLAGGSDFLNGMIHVVLVNEF